MEAAAPGEAGRRIGRDVPATERSSTIKPARFKPSASFPESLKFCAAFLQEVERNPAGVAPRVVMKAADLDETVQESLAMARSFQPYGFQRLVGFKEFPLVKQVDSFHNPMFHHHPIL